MVDFPTFPFLRFLLYYCLLLHFVIHWKKRKVRGIKIRPLPDPHTALQRLLNITSGCIRTLSLNVFSGLEKKWLKEPPNSVLNHNRLSKIASAWARKFISHIEPLTTVLKCWKALWALRWAWRLAFPSFYFSSSVELGVFGTGSAGNPQHLPYRSLCKGEITDIRTSQKPLTWTPTWFAQALKLQGKAKATSLPSREIGRMASTKMCKWVPPARRHRRRRRYMKTRSHLIPRNMSTEIKQTPSIVISRSLVLFLLPKMMTHTSFQIPTSFSTNWDALLQENKRSAGLRVDWCHHDQNILMKSVLSFLSPPS